MATIINGKGTRDGLDRMAATKRRKERGEKRIAGLKLRFSFRGTNDGSVVPKLPGDKWTRR